MCMGIAIGSTTVTEPCAARTKPARPGLIGTLGAASTTDASDINVARRHGAKLRGRRAPHCTGSPAEGTREFGQSVPQFPTTGLPRPTSLRVKSNGFSRVGQQSRSGEPFAVGVASSTKTHRLISPRSAGVAHTLTPFVPRSSFSVAMRPMPCAARIGPSSVIPTVPRRRHRRQTRPSRE